VLLTALNIPAEHLSHDPAIHNPVTWTAFAMALSGFLLATAFYGVRVLDPADARRSFAPIYWFLKNKWGFDELYQFLFVRPVLRIASWVAAVDKYVIDWTADHLALGVRAVSVLDDWIDRMFVDGLVNRTAAVVYGTGLWLRTLQTGRLRQYVMLIAMGTVALFVLVSLYWTYLGTG
jgi:NADH:ubiquinone oxidoreductase subunit 5 (subunit L)/multisubunit Na+/H+ antiporter MnhA subunit